MSRYRPGVTSLARALHEMLQVRGMSVADLARALDQPEPTVRNAVSGRVRRPNKALRDALDEFFDAPAGTTLDICEGRRPRYPSDERIRELHAQVNRLSAAAAEHLTGLLKALLNSRDDRDA